MERLARSGELQHAANPVSSIAHVDGAGFCLYFRAMLSAKQGTIVKHRGVDFDVEEKPPSWWHWKIYPKIEAGPNVVCSMTFQTREAAIAACIVQINSGLYRDQRGSGSK